MSDANFAPNLDEPLEVTQQARNYNAWLYGRARPHLGRRVLDLGAGIGTFTELAADDGRQVVALEPHTPYAELLEAGVGKRSGVEVVCSTVEKLRDRAPSPFDSVLCFNVLEHIEDDASTLRAAYDLLTPGGRLLLLVPAHPLLLGEVDRRLGHVRRYKRRPLARLLESVSFEVERIRYVNPIGALGWLVTFRLRSWPERWPRGQYEVFDRLVPMLTLLDRVPLPVGLSLWAVARRV